MALVLALSMAPVSAYADEGEPQGFDPIGALSAFFAPLSDGKEGGAPEGGPTEPENKVADPDTLTSWETGLSEDSTKTAGRIWTDKTVSFNDITLSGGITDPSGDTTTEGSVTIKNDEGTALVALSALSSASKITGYTYITKPLDIVLVLDNSGSMQGVALQQLKNAATNFVDAVASKSSGDVKHRVAIVQFAAGNQSKGEFLDCSQSSSSVDLKNKIDGITAIDKGSSAYEWGLERAMDLMSGARPEASKIVIVIGDGDRMGAGGGTSYYTGEMETAAKRAHDLKESGAIIYSIRISESADVFDYPGSLGGGESTRRSWGNVFMHVLSSNYPDATGTGHENSTDYGNRAPDSNYYLTGKDYSYLDQLFQQIVEQIVTNYALPITSGSGGGEDIGYLTFTDTLGSYVEVKDFKSVVYAGKKFEQAEKPKSYESEDGTITTTYTFVGKTEGNAVYGPADLSELIITVQSKELPASEGDVVTVKIPASLIPLRLYEANASNEQKANVKTTDAYPIRIFYTVGLKGEDRDEDEDHDKDGVLNEDGSVNTSVVNSGYIDDNSKDGLLNFYTNAFTEKEPNGDTTAVFTPAKTNRFYFFTEDTPLYTDKGVTPATFIENDETYYFNRPYYEGDKLVNDWVEVSGSYPLMTDSYVGRGEDGSFYIKKGTPRLTRADDFMADKTENLTGTASRRIAPVWEENDATVSVHLGNNGRFQYRLPEPTSSLSIGKTVDWGDGTEKSEKEFSFTVSLSDAEDVPLTGSFPYAVRDSEDNKIENLDGSVADGGTIKLKDGQHAVVENLPVGTKYKVEEALQPGFTPDEKTQEGVIDATGSEVKFTNTYEFSTSTTLPKESIKVSKILTGRDWLPGESFTFAIQSTNDKLGAPSDDPLPEATSISITNDDGEHKEGVPYLVSFGAIEYKKPGPYSYMVREVGGNKGGLQYSAACYKVIVEVDDNGDGTLSIPYVSSIEQVLSDDGRKVSSGEGSTDMTFTNTFTGKDSDAISLKGIVRYADDSDAPAPALSTFSFKLTGSEGAPMLKEVEVSALETGLFEFGSITFGKDDVGKTYTYTIEQVLPEGATVESLVLNGVTYDTHKAKITVTVSRDEKGNVAANAGYADPVEAVDKETRALFTNAYTAPDPTPPGPGGDDDEATGEGSFSFTKKLKGRDLKAGEFEFQLKKDDDSGEGVSAKNEADGTVKLPALTFDEEGEYKYLLFEKSGNAAGVTYDKRVYKVTATVKKESATKPSVEWSATLDGEDVGMKDIVFENVFKDSSEPEEPVEPVDPVEPEDPKPLPGGDEGDGNTDGLAHTGDAGFARIAGGFALTAALAAAFAAFCLRRRAGGFRSMR